MAIPASRFTRLFVLLVIAIPLLAGAGTRSAAAYQSDAQAAMDQAYYLSLLESNGQFNALYDLIHPDAHAVVPRDAVIGWYTNEFAPRGAYPARVTGVQFITWTWAVTGKTYYRTAEVSFSQTFYDGGQMNVIYDVVRLVQDDYGTWRWFFGRSREFVQEQVDRYVRPYPETTLLSMAVEDVGQFWAGIFLQGDLRYDAPDVFVYTGGTSSSCGWVGGGPAAYCPADMSIYVDEDWYFYTASAYGDFAWVTILAHEWGHHVQEEFRDNRVPIGISMQGVQQELLADCLAGVYAQDAEARGMLQSGDISEAVLIAMAAGDPEHGTGDDRLTAFMYGYLGGLLGCGIEI